MMARHLRNGSPSRSGWCTGRDARADRGRAGATRTAGCRGARYVAESLGDHALLRILAPFASSAPCRPPAHRAVIPEPAAHASEPHVTVEAALRDETLVSGVRLWRAPGPSSSPPVVEATVSRDGRAWQPTDGARAVPKWGWAGRTLFATSDDRVEVAFEPVPARHVRVVRSPAPRSRDSSASAGRRSRAASPRAPGHRSRVHRAVLVRLQPPRLRRAAGYRGCGTTCASSSPGRAGGSGTGRSWTLPTARGRPT